MIEVGIEREGANREENERDIGIHQEIEDLFLQRHAKRHDALTGETQRDFLVVEALKRFTFHLAKEITLAGGNILNEVLGEGFLLGEGFALKDCPSRYLDLAPSFRVTL